MILALFRATYFHPSTGQCSRDSHRCVFPAEDKQLQSVPVVSIIDDDESVRFAVRRLVRSLGLTARAFASAEEFMKSQHVNDASCLITDLQMPGMSGADLQSMLLARGRRIPIIFVTAFPEERVRMRALAMGALGFLSKPFDARALVELIDRALQTHPETCNSTCGP